MSLDWLLTDPKNQGPTLLQQAASASAIETWGPEWQIQVDLMVYGGPLVDARTPEAAIEAWREYKRGNWKYVHVYYMGRRVKAVHLPDCCECVRCHPEFHGKGKCMCHWPMPREHGPGICQCQWHRDGGYV